MKKVLMFKRFERFWHWSQALLIILMLLSGFEIHGSYQLFGFHDAVNLHTFCAWTLMGLWVFAIFWHFTTGEWKQYIPSSEQMLDIAKFYAIGIFKGEQHPYKAIPERKHNPLQRASYLGLKLFINPWLWISGLLLLFYSSWEALGITGLSLGTVATLHLIGGFLMLTFLIVHVYMTTTGHTVTTHIKAMITGYEEVEEEEAH